MDDESDDRAELRAVYRPATDSTYSASPVISVRQRYEAAHEVTVAYANAPIRKEAPEERKLVLVHFAECFHFAFNSAGLLHRWLDEHRSWQLGAGFGMFAGASTSYKTLMVGDGASGEMYRFDAEGSEPFYELDHFMIVWDDHGYLDVLCRTAHVVERTIPNYSRDLVLSLIESEFPIEPERHLD